MNFLNKICLYGMVVIGCTLSGCQKDLVKMNENPNGADPETTNPNLVLATVLTESAKSFVQLGYQDMAGLMQHTQKDGWADGHNRYDWDGSNSWAGYYDILRNNKFVQEKAIEQENTLLHGITLVMKSLMFGLITDLWGDAPYSQALKSDEGTITGKFPTYDTQQQIYEGILADLASANTILSQEVTGSVGNADVFFNGNPLAWRKFANSLALRYYMRLAEKLPAVAKEGIERIVANPEQYPIILQTTEDVTMSYPGNNNNDSWPSNATYDNDSSNYRRIKMCQTFVDALQLRNDPRIAIFANKVAIPLVVDESLPNGTDRIAIREINGTLRTVRELHSTALPSGTTVANLNQDPDYVGLPLGISVPYSYNLSTDLIQASRNPHVSWVNSSFADAKSNHKARVISAAEVNFILAEATAAYGWSAGDAEQHYYAGIQASFDAWGAGNASGYFTEAEVTFDGTQEQIVTQKWIASWTVATESWFDWRRTGYPQLSGATNVGRLPLRLYYMLSERTLNAANIQPAIERLEQVGISDQYSDGKNSIWSKPWIVQGTGKPW